jgi:hypothetical protein
MASSALIFTKLTIIQQIFVVVSDTEYFPNRIENVENARKNIFTSLNKEWHSLRKFSQNSVTPRH